MKGMTVIVKFVLLDTLGELLVRRRFFLYSEDSIRQQTLHNVDTINHILTCLVSDTDA